MTLEPCGFLGKMYIQITKYNVENPLNLYKSHGFIRFVSRMAFCFQHPCYGNQLNKLTSNSNTKMHIIGRHKHQTIWVFPKIGGKTPKWMVKIMQNPIKMDYLGVPLFLETPIYKHSSERLSIQMVNFNPYPAAVTNATLETEDMKQKCLFWYLYLYPRFLKTIHDRCFVGFLHIKNKT